MITKSLPKKIGPKKKKSDATKIKKKQISYMIRKADLEKLPEIDKRIKRAEYTEELMKHFEFTEKARDNNVTWEQTSPNTMTLFYPKTGKSVVFICDNKTPNQYKIFKLKQLLGEFD